MLFLKESEIFKSVHDISSKTTSSNMTFRRIRHLVEKASFFFFFFMYDILSKLFLFIFVVNDQKITHGVFSPGIIEQY